MKFTPTEQTFLARYGPGADFAAIRYYELTQTERGIAKVFQIRNLLTFAGDEFGWTEYGKGQAGEVKKE